MSAPAVRPGTGARVGDPLLDVRDLRIERLGTQPETIVSSVSLAVRAGETIGIVGESGSGKSMTARALVGLLPERLRATGHAQLEGRNLIDLDEKAWRSVRGREIGLILQDPFSMLNPVMRCGRIVEESLVDARGWSSASRRAEVGRRLAEVGIDASTVARRYPFQLSGGMRQRVAIAAALARDPRVLIADEPSTALDVATQRDILALIKRIQAERGMGVILITHDLRVAFSTCDGIHVLYAGSVLETAPADELAREPMHPYSHGLLLSEPPLDRRLEELTSIPGAVPRPDDVAGRCTFSDRCRWTIAACTAAAPPLVDVAPSRQSGCVRLDDIRGEMQEAARVALRVRVDGEPGAGHATQVVRATALRKEFRHGGGALAAVDGVSIAVDEGDAVGLVGESGSGKTTLARLLVGLETATGGELAIDGIAAHDRNRLTAGERARLRDTIQIIFQDPYSSLNPRRTVGATLAEAITLRNAAARNVRAEVGELLDSVGLPLTYVDRKPAALSGGERQRVAIARALGVRPRILICDEPVSALDVSVQAQVLNLLAALRRDRGLGYLFITHDLSAARQVADVLYVMQRGRIVESGPTERIFDAPEDPYTVELLTAVPQRESDRLGTSAP